MTSRIARFLLLASLSLLTPSLAAHTGVIEGVPLATEISLAGQKLRLNGAGVRTFLGFRVYVAALYLPHPIQEAELILNGNLPRRLQVTLLRDTTTEQNLDALRGGLEDNHGAAEMEALAADVASFFLLVRQVHEVPAGASILLDYLPGEGTRLSIGGRYLGRIPGERFNRAILKIWLGRAPIQASLKKSLLGGERPAL